jgi:hypothetical protein
MTVPAGVDSSNCSLVDEHGRQLLLATYRRDGGLKVRWGDAHPVQPVYSATPEGWLQFIVMEGPNRYEVTLDPAGVSGVRAFDVHNGRYHGLGYTKNGELVDDPWLVGAVPQAERDPSERPTPAAKLGETTAPRPSSNPPPPASSRPASQRVRA